MYNMSRVDEFAKKIDLILMWLSYEPASVKYCNYVQKEFLQFTQYNFVHQYLIVCVYYHNM